MLRWSCLVFFLSFGVHAHLSAFACKILSTSVSLNSSAFFLLTSFSVPSVKTLFNTVQSDFVLNFFFGVDILHLCILLSWMSQVKKYLCACLPSWTFLSPLGEILYWSYSGGDKVNSLQNNSFGNKSFAALKASILLQLNLYLILLCVLCHSREFGQGRWVWICVVSLRLQMHVEACPAN